VQVAGAQQDLANFGRAMIEGASLRKDAQRLLENLGAIDRRVEQIRIESRAPARVREHSEAVAPSQPSRDSRASLFFALIAGSLGSGAAAALLLASRNSAGLAAGDEWLSVDGARARRPLGGAAPSRKGIAA
jgi:hypothetical protein